MVLVFVAVVAITGFAVYRLHGIFGSHNAVSRPSADSPESTNYNPKRVLFEVFGPPGTVATINYLDMRRATAARRRRDAALVANADDDRPHAVRRSARSRGRSHDRLPHHRQRHRHG